MLVRYSWHIGMLAALLVTSIPLAGALAEPLTGATNDGPLAPKPITTNTLPGPLGIGAPVFWDAFDWCPEYPCSWIDGPPISQKMTHASGGASVAGNAWLVQEGGADGSGAFAYVSDTANRPFDLRIRPDTGFASPGEHLVVSFVATGPAHATGTDGGIRLQIDTRHLGLSTGFVDCRAVPVVPLDDGYWEFVPANPACKTAPATGQIVLRFTVDSGTQGNVPDDVAIDRVHVARL